MLTLAEDLVAARERAGLLDEPKAQGQPQPVSQGVCMLPRPTATLRKPDPSHSDSPSTHRGIWTWTQRRKGPEPLFLI